MPGKQVKYILQVFGDNKFRKLHYINFKKDKTALKIFEIDLTPIELINSIELNDEELSIVFGLGSPLRKVGNIL